MRRLLYWGLLMLGAVPLCAAEPAKLVDVRKIWDRAPHNAFTDLIRFHDRWYCVFREGAGHVSPDGALRVITSADGQAWDSAALVTSPDSDLRDAKISVTPDGQLMLAGAGALHDKSQHTHQSLAWFSNDGRTWSKAYPVGDPDFWLWRVTWHEGRAYGVGYGCGDKRSIRLYSSNDGKTFDTLVKSLIDIGYPNETSLVFEQDTCYCLLRRDGKLNTGLLGVSQPPYTEWKWKDLGVRIGGPHMIRLPDGRFVAAVRLYDGMTRTSLAWVDPRAGTITEFLKLPSGGDTSYAGLALHDDLLWVSYYSSHEGKTSIYLAQVQLPDSDALSLAPEVRQRCLDTLRGALRCEEFWPAMHAAEALTLAGEGSEVVTSLRDRMPSERDDQHRCGLVRELVRAGQHSDLPILFEILADPNSSGRIHAAESLYKIGEPGDGKLLQAALAQPGNPKLQLMAAAALAKAGDRAALRHLREQLRSTELSSRNLAAFALARVGDRSDVEPLANALDRETDAMGRAFLISALACLGDAPGRKELGFGLDTNDPGVRALLAECAGTSRCLEHGPKLMALLDDPVLDVRVRAAQSLLTLSRPADE